MSNSETIPFFLKMTTAARVSVLHFDLLIDNLGCISSRLYRRSQPSFPSVISIWNTETFHLKLGHRERILQFFQISEVS